MLIDTHVREALPAYALGSLEEAEAQLVAEHLAGCTLCRKELESYQTVADQLLFALPEAMPSAELKPRLIENINRLKRQQTHEPTGWRLRKQLLPVGAFAGLILIISLAVSNVMLWSKLTNSEVLKGPLGMRAIALQNTVAAAGASGFVIISADGENGVVVVDELPPLAEGYEYQLWLVQQGGQSISGGLFSVDESGYRGMRIEAPESLLVYSFVTITIEPAGGSTKPVGEEVLGGSLFNP